MLFAMMVLAFLLLPDIWAEAAVLAAAVAGTQPLATLFDRVMLVGLLTLLCFLGFGMLAELMR